MKLTPLQAMELALEEGKKGAGFVSPNPCVGCVILDKNGNLIGQGFHQKYGEAHAEINALKSVKDPKSLKDAEIYVTLEPCAHEGKTGSCAKALAQLPIGKVVYGLIDPFPQVAGKGVEILRNAGIKVEQFKGLEDALTDLCEIFLHNVRTQLPFVALKIGSSLDGMIALESGQSQWITGEESRAKVQNLRGQYDAILVGAKTLEFDNPSLNSRDPKFKNKISKVVIFDGEGVSAPFLKKSRLAAVHAPENIYFVTSQKMSISPFNLVQVPVDRNHQLELRSALASLKSLGIHSLLVEGGAATYSAFLQSRMFQRLHLFQAPLILGKGLGWSSKMTVPDLASGLKLQNASVERLGADFYFSAKVLDQSSS